MTELEKYQFEQLQETISKLKEDVNLLRLLFWVLILINIVFCVIGIILNSKKES